MRVFIGKLTDSNGICTMNCRTLISPQSICRDDDMIMLIAMFPSNRDDMMFYDAPPAEDKSIVELLETCLGMYFSEVPYIYAIGCLVDSSTKYPFMRNYSFNWSRD